MNVIDPNLLARSKRLMDLKPLNDVEPKMAAQRKPLEMVKSDPLPSPSGIKQFFRNSSSTSTSEMIRRYDEITEASKKLELLKPPAATLHPRTISLTKHSASSSSSSSSSLLQKKRDIDALVKKHLKKSKEIDVSNCNGFDDEGDSECDEIESETENDRRFIVDDDNEEEDSEEEASERDELDDIDEGLDDDDEDANSSSQYSDDDESGAETELDEDRLRKRLREEDEQCGSSDDEEEFISVMNNLAESDEIKEEKRVRRLFKVVDCKESPKFFNMVVAIFDSLGQSRKHFDSSTISFLSALFEADDLFTGKKRWASGHATINACYLWLVTKRRCFDILCGKYKHEPELIKFLTVMRTHETVNDIPIYEETDDNTHVCFRSGAPCATGISVTDVHTKEVLATIWYDHDNTFVAFWLNTLVRLLFLPMALQEWRQRKQERIKDITTHKQRLQVLAFLENASEIFVDFLNDEFVCESKQGLLFTQ